MPYALYLWLATIISPPTATDDDRNRKIFTFATLNADVNVFASTNDAAMCKCLQTAQRLVTTRPSWLFTVVFVKLSIPVDVITNSLDTRSFRSLLKLNPRERVVIQQSGAETNLEIKKNVFDWQKVALFAYILR